MFEINTDNSVPVTEIKFTGTISVQNSAETKEILLDSYKKNGNLTIDISEVESTDITFLQTLVALRKTMQADGKSLKLNGGKSEVFKKLLVDAGFTGYEWLTAEIDNNPEGKTL